jgi:hypothetical protein
VFGAKSHKYVGTRVPLVDLEGFQTHSGCHLPADYRHFLAEIGTGVGPYYGLLPLSKIKEELKMIAEDYQAAGTVPATPDDPFDLEKQVLDLKVCGTLDFPNLHCPKTSGGFIPIWHHGCEFVTVLIVSGLCAGMVMDTTNIGSTPSLWFPSKCPPGVVEYGRKRTAIPDFPAWPTFADWIDGWLRQSVFGLS